MTTDWEKHRAQLSKNGYTVIANVFTREQMNELGSYINAKIADAGKENDVHHTFACRRFLSSFPECKQQIFSEGLKETINKIIGKDFFVVKSIFFNKPADANWFVAWHRDTTIAVCNKVEMTGYKSWTKKHNQFAVQPPIDILESMYTIRIHVDDCNADNGALYVMPGSHRHGICDDATSAIEIQTAACCAVSVGGVMLMRPMLRHASHRSTTPAPRRVLHIELSNIDLPAALGWAEKESIT